MSRNNGFIRHDNIYPWENWLDGRVWLLRAATEFGCMPRSIVSQAAKAARRSSQVVASRTLHGNVGDPVLVLIQAYDAGSTWKPNLRAIDAERVHKALRNPR